MTEQLNILHRNIIAKQAELNHLYAQAYLMSQSVIDQLVEVSQVDEQVAEQVRQAEAQYGQGVYL